MRETGSRPVAFCQNRAQWILHIGLLLFGHNLTWPSGTKSDPGRCRTIWSGPHWMQETGSGPVPFCQNRAQWFLHTGLLPEQILLATTWRGHPESNPAKLAQIRFGSEWLSGCGKTDPIRKKNRCAELFGPVSGKMELPRFQCPTSDSVPFFQRQSGLCCKRPTQIWFGSRRLSGCGQTDPVQKKAGVQESSGPVLAKWNRPATSF